MRCTAQQYLRSRVETRARRLRRRNLAAQLDVNTRRCCCDDDDDDERMNFNAA